MAAKMSAARRLPTTALARELGAMGPL